jgi:hypothetical protein
VKPKALGGNTTHHACSFTRILIQSERSESSSMASACVLPAERRFSCSDTALSSGDCSTAISSMSHVVAGSRRMFCMAAGRRSMNFLRDAAGMVSRATATVLSTLAMFEASWSDLVCALVSRKNWIHAS